MRNADGEESRWVRSESGLILPRHELADDSRTHGGGSSQSQIREGVSQRSASVIRGVATVGSVVVAILGLLVAFGSLQAQRNINDDQMQLNAEIRARERQRNAEKVKFDTVAQPAADRSTAAVRVYNRSYSALTGVQIRAYAPMIQSPSTNPADHVKYKTWLAGTVEPCSVVTLEIPDLPANIVRPSDSTNIDGPLPWVFLLSFFTAEGEWTIAADHLQPSSADDIYTFLGIRDPNPGLEFLQTRNRDQAAATDCA